MANFKHIEQWEKEIKKQDAEKSLWGRMGDYALKEKNSGSNLST